MSTFERMPFEARNAVFKKLSEITDVTSLSKEERDRYDESLKIMRDYNATMKGAIIQGRAEGKEQGLIEGRAEGRAEVNAHTAKLMLDDGEPIEKIMRYTGLSESDIKSLN